MKNKIEKLSDVDEVKKMLIDLIESTFEMECQDHGDQDMITTPISILSLWYNESDKKEKRLIVTISYDLRVKQETIANFTWFMADVCNYSDIDFNIQIGDSHFTDRKSNSIWFGSEAYKEYYMMLKEDCRDIIMREHFQEHFIEHACPINNVEC